MCSVIDKNGMKIDVKAVFRLQEMPVILVKNVITNTCKMCQTWVKSDVPEGLAVPAPLVAHIVFI